MVTYEFWRERASGEVFAVSLRDGVVAGCCGPLRRSELDETFLDSLDYATERAAWLEANREAFTLLEPSLHV